MSSEHLTILTGASRGMGLAMARQLLREGHHLLCIARHADAALAQAGGAHCTQWQADLADGATVAARLDHWLAAHHGARWTSATLINNAGTIPALVPLAESDPAELAQALRVGLEAPMLLTAAFLGATAGWSGRRRVLNVSSGLARRAQASQSAYCAAKAGLEHFTRCVALDEAPRPNGARVCALSPGVIDTAMQAQLRGADASRFPDQGAFAQLHANGQLASAEAAAARVLAYLARPDFGTQPVADVRDAA
ncbi:SDR family NAD(P)-dependent oxidoreductase [Pseudorhodoferax sp.]|uniref:SDR family NAD(P)-dependent oxidoreductase n=1 Tax=Pseudorhodoferax sp. TaxID=1993553 RepID=UPI0039E6F8C8